jgi:hypothetical protein
MATAQLGTLLRHIHKLAAGSNARPWTDRELLDDFASRRGVRVTSVGGTDVYAVRMTVDLTPPKCLPLVRFASE